jgi:hypothetical protein
MEASLAAAMAKVAALNPGAVVPAAGVGGVGLTAAGAGALFIALQTLKDQEWIAGVCQSQINCTFALAAAGGFIATLDLAEVALDHALGENSNPAADVALQGLRVSVEGLTQLGFVIAKVCPESAALFTAMIGQKVAKARNRIEQASAGGGGAENRLGTLTRAGDNVWDSAGGLRYAGTDRAGLNRVQHVLRHADVDPSRATHSVFNVGRNKVLALVDEAWGMRGNPLANDPGAYVVPMGRAVGTAGENAVKIIVRPGTNEIITSYPVFVP